MESKPNVQSIVFSKMTLWTTVNISPILAMPLRKALEIELGKYIGQGGENCRQDNLIHGSVADRIEISTDFTLLLSF